MDHPAAPSSRVGQQPHPGKVELTLRTGLAIHDPYRGCRAAEPAPLHAEPVQRPVGHPHAAPPEQDADLGHRQILGHPDGDPGLLGRQRRPRRAVPTSPRRAHLLHHLADQLIGELRQAAVAGQAGVLGRLHVPAGGLAVHSRPLSHRAQALPRQPGPQHLPHLDHLNLPERHGDPPSPTTWSDPTSIRPASVTRRRVVPSLATGWSHDRGRNPPRTVPCSWQATASTT
jgi:hypothetical protein